MAANIRRGARVHLYITEWREFKDLSVEEVANRLDVSRTTVWRWETGKRRVTPDIQARIAHALNLDRPEDLWRLPDTRASIDAMLDGAPDDLHEAVADLARRLTRRAH